MTDETAITTISHEDVDDILIAGDCLRFELHNGVIVSLPSKNLSWQHYSSNSKLRADILISNDWSTITWPQLNVALNVNDILQHWLIQPSQGPNRLVDESDKWFNHPQGKPFITESTVPVDDQPGRIKLRHYSRASANTLEKRVQRLEERVAQLENSSTETPPPSV